MPQPVPLESLDHHGGRMLRELRTARKLSLSDVGAAVDRGPSSISAWEREGRIPSPRVLNRILDLVAPSDSASARWRLLTAYGYLPPGYAPPPDILLQLAAAAAGKPSA